MFEGGVKVATHETFDGDGNLVSTVRVSTPGWSVASREKVLALHDWDEGFCGCGCGVRLEDSLNPDQAWMVHETTCHARRRMEQIKRGRYDKEKHPNRPEGWDDGLRFWVVKATDQDIANAAKKSTEAPVRPRAEAARQRRRRQVADRGD